MLKRRAILAALILSCSTIVRADDIKNNIGANLNSKAMDAFATDLGAIIGGSSFHSGATLGFPVGFDVGFHANTVQLDSDDTILRDDGKSATAEFVQGELGLPAGFNLLARYGKVDKADVYGGGLRYGIIDSDTIGMPSISIAGLYNQISHDAIKGNVITGNLVLSFDVPIVHPYIGAGYDWTSIETKGVSLKGDGSGYRVEGGINLSLIPFTYISLGGGVSNGRRAGHAGVGVRF